MMALLTGDNHDYRSNHSRRVSIKPRCWLCNWIWYRKDGKMNMTDTPETDAHVSPFKSEFANEIVSSDFARKLERQRNALEAAMRIIADDCDVMLMANRKTWSPTLRKVIRDMADEARAALAKL
jgi:hypothetical protein